MRRQFLKFFSIALLAISLTACGFTPLYSERDATLANGLSSINVKPITTPEKAGFEVQQALKDRLQPNGPAAFELTVKLSDNRQSLAVTQSANTVRFNYVLKANYQLADLKTGKKWNGKVSSVSGYGTVKSQYATLVGEDDAVRKAALELADKMEIELALFIRGARTNLEQATEEE